MTSPYASIVREARSVKRAKPLTQYQRDPLAYAADELGLKPESMRWGLVLPSGHQWDGTPEPLCTGLTALADGQDAGIESATGTGKSVCGAVAMLWFLACWENARVFTFATKEEQLRLYIWTELHRLGLFDRFKRRFPDATLLDLELRVRGGAQDDGWSAHGVSVAVRAGQQVSAGAAGMHAPDMLLIYEETQGIHPAVIAAGENTATAPHNLRLFLGNPDHQLDTLHQACTSPGVVHIRCSALDHPNVAMNREVVPGAVSVKTVERRRVKYGEKGRLYLSRVRGISPAESAEALIKLEWIQRANARWLEKEKDGTLAKWGEPALGVDVANSEDGDDAAIAYGRGHVLLTLEAFPCPDANQLGWRVGKRMDTETIAPDRVAVDTVGVGAGTFNELARLKKYVRSFNGGASPEYEFESEEEYANLRAQGYWRLREDLRLDAVDLPVDTELARDLVTPEWTTRGGKIVVEAKEDIKKRLSTDAGTKGKSPNKGDAVVYWNFVRDRSPLAQPIPQGPRVVHGDPTFQAAWMPEAHDTNPIGDDGDTDARDWLGGRIPQGF